MRSAADRVPEEIDDLVGKGRVDLEQSRASRSQHAPQTSGGAPDELEAVLSSRQRDARLERERCPVAEQMLERHVPQVGQVRDDHVETLAEGREQVALTEFDAISDTVVLGVDARDREGVV